MLIFFSTSDGSDSFQLLKVAIRKVYEELESSEIFDILKSISIHKTWLERNVEIIRRWGGS